MGNRESKDIELKVFEIISKKIGEGLTLTYEGDKRRRYYVIEEGCREPVSKREDKVKLQRMILQIREALQTEDVRGGRLKEIEPNIVKEMEEEYGEEEGVIERLLQIPCIVEWEIQGVGKGYGRIVEEVNTNYFICENIKRLYSMYIDWVERGVKDKRIEPIEQGFGLCERGVNSHRKQIENYMRYVSVLFRAIEPIEGKFRGLEGKLDYDTQRVLRVYNTLKATIIRASFVEGMYPYRGEEEIGVEELADISGAVEYVHSKMLQDIKGVIEEKEKEVDERVAYIQELQEMVERGEGKDFWGYGIVYDILRSGTNWSNKQYIVLEKYKEEVRNRRRIQEEEREEGVLESVKITDLLDEMREKGEDEGVLSEVWKRGQRGELTGEEVCNLREEGEKERYTLRKEIKIRQELEKYLRSGIDEVEEEVEEILRYGVITHERLEEIRKRVRK